MVPSILISNLDDSRFTWTMKYIYCWNIEGAKHPNSGGFNLILRF